MKSVICPMCESGELSMETYGDELLYNGRPLQVSNLERCRCASCGSDPVLPDQIRRNQARYTDARRAADGLLTGIQIRAVRESLRLTQADAARVFGGGPNGFSKYERGEVTQSVAMDRLLRVVSANYWLMDFMFALAGIDARGTHANDASYSKGVPYRLGSIGPRFKEREGSGKVVYRSDWARAKGKAA